MNTSLEKTAKIAILLFILALLLFTLFRNLRSASKEFAHIDQIILQRTDLHAFYAAAKIIHSPEASSLYDYKFQESFILKQISLWTTPEAGEMKVPAFFYNPPNSLWLQYLLGFADSPRFYYLGFLFLNSILVFLSIFLGISCVEGGFKRFVLGTLLYFGVSFFPLASLCVQAGQLGLAISCCCFLAYYFRDKNPWLAALLLSFTLFKPQLGLPIVFVFLLAGYFRVALGAIFFTAIQVLLSAAFLGFAGLKLYIMLALQTVGLVKFGLFFPKPAGVESISGFVQLFFSLSSKELSLVSGIWLLLCLVTIYLVLNQKVIEFSLRFALALLVALVVASYHNDHDYCLWFAVALIALESRLGIFSSCLFFCSCFASYLALKLRTVALLPMPAFSALTLGDLKWYFLNTIGIVISSILFLFNQSKEDEKNIANNGNIRP